MVLLERAHIDECNFVNKQLAAFPTIIALCKWTFFYFVLDCHVAIAALFLTGIYSTSQIRIEPPSECSQ